MKRTVVTVTYPGRLDSFRDLLIRFAAKLYTGRNLGSGFDFVTQERDQEFDFKFEHDADCFMREVRKYRLGKAKVIKPEPPFEFERSKDGSSRRPNPKRRKR
jgi:hypothetical protein